MSGQSSHIHQHTPAHQDRPSKAVSRAWYAAELRRLADRGDVEVVLPLHRSPAVREALLPELDGHPGVRVVDPLDYLDLAAPLAGADGLRRAPGGGAEPGQARWWRIGGLVLAVALVAGALMLAGVWDEDRPPEPVETWRDGEVHGPWRSVFHGYGSNVGEADELMLTPRAARRKDRTHACPPTVVASSSWPPAPPRSGSATGPRSRCASTGPGRRWR